MNSAAVSAVPHDTETEATAAAELVSANSAGKATPETEATTE